MAISIGKKSIKTGVNKVPNPNPEKKVKMAVKKATIDMIMISKIKKLTWLTLPSHIHA